MLPAPDAPNCGAACHLAHDKYRSHMLICGAVLIAVVIISLTGEGFTTQALIDMLGGSAPLAIEHIDKLTGR